MPTLWTLVVVLTYASCACASNDASTLLQATANSEAGSGVEFSPLRLFWKSATKMTDATMHPIKYGRQLYDTYHHFGKHLVNCSQNPVFCAEPLKCHEIVTTAADLRNTMRGRITKPDGHANVWHWCLGPNRMFETSIAKECLVNKDPVKSGQKVFDLQKQQGLDVVDASYCFREKHCLDNKVTVNTTVLEAEALCDEKYGHDAWRKMSVFDLKLPKKHWNNVDGYFESASPKMFGKLACAMGNYHCDVIYCKTQFCNNEFYSKKFRHHLDE